MDTESKIEINKRLGIFEHWVLVRIGVGCIYELGVLDVLKFRLERNLMNERTKA
jgi:hypothetical protein